MDDEIHVRFQCTLPKCQQHPRGEFTGTIKKYQLALVAIWFHSNHEGHHFRYWEDGEIILGQDPLRAA